MLQTLTARQLLYIVLLPNSLKRDAKEGISAMTN